MFDNAFRNWLITTITAFLLLGVVILSFVSLNGAPVIVLPEGLDTVLLFAALAALGISTAQSYHAVRTSQEWSKRLDQVFKDEDA